jgi:MFS transporter, OFA family, oxalate/formate antiporter
MGATFSRKSLEIKSTTGSRVRRKREFSNRASLGGFVFFTWGEIYSLFPGRVHRPLLPPVRQHQLRPAVHGERHGRDPGAARQHADIGTGSWSSMLLIAATLKIIAAVMALLVLKPLRPAAVGGKA